MHRHGEAVEGTHTGEHTVDGLDDPALWRKVSAYR